MIWKMSYEIAKSIRIDNKNKKIFLRSSSNNIYPKEYPEWEYMKEEPDLEIKKRNLFYSILKGSLSLQICNNIDWKYASLKFFEYCKENDISSSELYDLSYKKDSQNELEKYYKIFEKFIEEKHDGLYYIDSDIGIIPKINKRSFKYTKFKMPSNEFCFNYKKAYINLKKLSDETIKKYNIKIKEYEKEKSEDIGESRDLWMI